VSETVAGRPEPETLRSIIGYCRLAERLASESAAPEAIGLARAYQDVADRLDDRLAALTPTPVPPVAGGKA
jgi:hypothetical protein